MGSVDTDDKMSIHLIIIGAGLAGLSAAISTKVANPGHQVTILESVKELAEIGVCSPPHITFLLLFQICHFHPSS